VVQVELPTGTVTLLFTDIEGSTRLLRSLGDDYGAVLRAHRTILRDAVGRHGGVEFGTEGDACFLAFPAAAAALAAAAEAQHALAAAEWPDGARPRVRLLAAAAAIRSAAGTPLGGHQRVLLARALAPASAALGRDVLGVAADDVAEGRAMIFDQALDSQPPGPTTEDARDMTDDHGRRPPPTL
jgi:hypothetical protein